MINATGLYRKLEIYSHKYNVPMTVISNEIFGNGQRIIFWRDGHIPPQSKLRDVQQFLADVGENT